MIFDFVKRKFCEHAFKPYGLETQIEDTLSWGMKPTKQYRQEYKCIKCGKTKQRKYIYFGGGI